MMGRHKSNDKNILKNIVISSSSPSSSQPSIESHVVLYKRRKMSAFIDTFYNSFSSAGPRNKKQQQRQKSEPIYAEIELLKVTAPKYDLEKFAKEISKIHRNVGIEVEITVVIPSRKNEERIKALERQEKESQDFLDYVFSDTIPFLHEFLMFGSPEAQFFQIKGEKDALDIFNKLCGKMIYNKGLQCKLEVTDRRRIEIGRRLIEDSMFGTQNSKTDLLDSMFTADFSKSNPFLHNLLVA